MVKSFNNLDLHLKLWLGQINRHFTPAVLLFKNEWTSLFYNCISQCFFYPAPTSRYTVFSLNKYLIMIQSADEAGYN